MEAQILAVRFGGLSKTESAITDYYWRNTLGQTEVTAKAEMVARVERGLRAYVGEGSMRVAVRVVDATPKYLRTEPDRFGVNNLLSLPAF